jgi:hypothetical protein
LAASGADAVVVGAWAVGFHGEPRFTNDLDLLIGQEPSNLLRVVRALRAFGAPPSVLESLRNLGPDELLFFGSPPSRVDLLRRIPGVDFREAHARSVLADWGGVPVRVLCKQDLICAKRAAGRAKDRDDLRRLGASPAPRRRRRTR